VTEVRQRIQASGCSCAPKGSPPHQPKPATHRLCVDRAVGAATGRGRLPSPAAHSPTTVPSAMQRGLTVCVPGTGSGPGRIASG
jgi:hypothetical protein